MAGIDTSGRILRPNKLFSLIDRFLSASVLGETVFQVQASYSLLENQPLPTYYVLVIDVPEKESVRLSPASDLFPRSEKFVDYYWRSYAGLPNARDCTGATATCVTRGSGDLQVHANPHEDEFQRGWSVYTLFPVLECGWTLLGELDKYVAVSSVRLARLQCSPSQLGVEATGGAGEMVTIHAISPTGVLKNQTLAMKGGEVATTFSFSAP